MSRHPTPVAAAKLIAKLADALGYAHQQGVVHRNVKPDNILLDHAGNPFLVDFGCREKLVGESWSLFEAFFAGRANACFLSGWMGVAQRTVLD